MYQITKARRKKVFIVRVNKKEKAMDRKNWLKKRNKGIGGSDASAIIGANPYKSNVELWLEKTGRKQPEDISNKDFVKYGINAEESLRNLFALDYPEFKVEYKKFDMFYHPNYPFLFGSLDGRLEHIETGLKGIYEGKTTNILSSQHKEKWADDNIPQNYYVQILHYMLVTGFDFAVINAQLKFIYPDNNTKITDFVLPDRQIKTIRKIFWRKDCLDDINYLLEQEVKFWQEYVEKDIEPPLVLPRI